MFDSDNILKKLYSWMKLIATDLQSLTDGGQTALHSHAGGGGGDMYKSTYDPNADGVIASAQLDPATETTSGSQTKVNTHAGLPSAHHTAFTQTNHDALPNPHHAEAHTHTGVYEPANANIQTHVIAAHAPSNAQKNSDILKSEIEAKLTGEIATHTHAGGGGDGEVAIVATGDTANATTTLANATGLSISALANSTYIIEGFILWNASVATVGIKLSATASGTPTITAGHFITDAVNGTPDSSSYNANDVVVTTSASPFTTYNMGMLNAILKTSASASTWQLRFAAETTGTITIKSGSTLRYRKVA